MADGVRKFRQPQKRSSECFSRHLPITIKHPPVPAEYLFSDSLAAGVGRAVAGVGVGVNVGLGVGVGADVGVGVGVGECA